MQEYVKGLMSRATRPENVLFFCSCLFRSDLFSDQQIIDLLRSLPEFQLVSLFGAGQYALLDYYAKEMGEHSQLKRFWVFGQQPSPRKGLVPMKQWAESIEQDTLLDGKRVLNFDPGYIALDQVLLSTGKPYSHRVYLGDGIYAELTYQAQNSGFSTFPWTYPDYLRPEVIEVFEFQRQFLKNLKRGP